jgi:hypothetical protein
MIGQIFRLKPLREGVALKLFVFLASAAIGIAAYLYYARSTSVLYRYVEAGNPTKEPAFTIFNPFRNREPESRADRFLEQVGHGNCEQAIAALPHTAQYIHDTCEREAKYPLASWHLKNRTDGPQNVRLYFQVARNNYDDIPGGVWITVEGHGEEWQVTRYESIY